MNKKGFTLIELLATITIMGLLLLLISPSIKNLQKNNNKKKFEVYGETLLEAAKSYVQKEGEDITSIGASEWTGCVDITYQELINNNLLKKFQDSNYDCSSSKVRFTKNEDGTSSYTYDLICTTTKSNKENYISKNISASSCSVKAKEEKTAVTETLIARLILKT